MQKTEYIKQLKQLIKKYHPDLCTDANLESQYNEITKKLVNALNKIKDKKEERKKEDDYAFYKQGIKHYKDIHPNAFYRESLNETYQTKPYKELVSALNKIFLSFQLSEYYFKELIKEYPNSSYCADAIDKLELLEKLRKRYKNMNIAENETSNYSQFVSDMGLKIM